MSKKVKEGDRESAQDPLNIENKLMYGITINFMICFFFFKSLDYIEFVNIICLKSDVKICARKNCADNTGLMC